jgi:hypothetical protein
MGTAYNWQSLLRKALIYPPKRQLHPERYMQFPKMVDKII